jgi:glutamate carboxypeptidase
MYAVHLLAEVGDDEYGQVTFLCNSDEEVGSPSSKGLVRELAGQHDAVLVFEPGRQRQRVVSARKCNGHYTLKVWGRAAHAGVEPHLGRSAILELAHQIQQLHALNGTIAGVTVNVGIVRGGERTNIVADYASCEIDVRAADLAGITAIEEAMHAVTTQHAVEDTRVELSGSMGSYPFERSTRNLPLLALARTAGAELGIAIEDVASGGASDANHAVPAGTPVLDGLGASGGLAHNPDEYIELDYLPERIALVMGLLKRIHTLSGA